MLVTVEITQQHIDKGEKLLCNHCPVALALRDAVPNSTKAEAYRNFLSVWIDDVRYWTRTPLDVSEFIAFFDHGHTFPLVGPFKFTAKFLPVGGVENA